MFLNLNQTGRNAPEYAHDAALPDELEKAIHHKGFSVVETLGMCTGRYTKRNNLTPKVIDQMIQDQPVEGGVVEKNQRPEYGELYRKLAREKTRFPEALTIEKSFDLVDPQRQEVVCRHERIH